jgi:hypothetical protein
MQMGISIARLALIHDNRGILQQITALAANAFYAAYWN